MKLLSHENKGSLYAIGSGLFFGLVGYFGMSIMHANLSISVMLFWRFFIGSVAVGLVLILQRKPTVAMVRDDATHLLTTSGEKKILSPLILRSLQGVSKDISQSTELLKVFFYGAAFYAPSTMIYFTASKSLGTGLGMVIFFTFPAMIMLINWVLYKTRIPKSYYGAIALIMIGMVLLVDIHEFSFDMIGIGLGLLSAFFYACYAIASKKSNVPPIISTLMVSLGCMSTCFIGAILTNNFIIPSTIIIWANVIGMGIICTALPILFFLESLKYISAEKASILSVLEPVFVVIFGVLLLNETIGMLQIMGVITILAGAMITLKNGNKH